MKNKKWMTVTITSLILIIIEVVSKMETEEKRIEY